MGLFDGLLMGFGALTSQPLSFLIISAGLAAGIIFGAMPGISSPMAIALLLPFTYGMEAGLALCFLVATYVGTVFGGGITAILFKAPGTPEAAVDTYDGYPMAQKQPERALGIQITCSAIGGICACLIFLFATYYLARWALHFAAPEYFGLALLGLAAVTSLGVRNQRKAIIACLLGLFLATVGMGQFGGESRFVFGSQYLAAGISYVPAVIGIFAAAEIFKQGYAPSEIAFKKVATKFSALTTGVKEVAHHKLTIFKSMLLGTFIGILPGTGSTISSFIAYGEAVRSSKHPEKFGTGVPEGLVAPETANNAASAGTMVPTLALGIPGGSASAVILAAMMIYGLTPGPLIIQLQPKLLYMIFVAMLFSDIVAIIFMLPAIRFFAVALTIPRKVLNPLIILLCITGSFAISNNVADVLVMFAFGVLGYLLERYKYPIAPVVLGIILGPVIERGLTTGLVLMDYNVLAFVSRPITAVLLVMAVAFAASPIVRDILKKRRVTVKEKN